MQRRGVRAEIAAEIYRMTEKVDVGDNPVQLDSHHFTFNRSHMADTVEGEVVAFTNPILCVHDFSPKLNVRESGVLDPSCDAMIGGDEK